MAYNIGNPDPVFGQTHKCDFMGFSLNIFDLL